jgi:tRNA threonylcarbamoyladenosine biosynthesis protein TsaE
MKIVIPSEQAMQEFGTKLSKLLTGGMTLELIGDVGAGKTTLTRSIARGLGITDPIHSPTFTISNRYETPNGLLLAHYDFYRLSDAGIMKDELAEVLEDERTITIIEWGDIVEEILPDSRITIRIRSDSERSRQLDCTAHNQVTQKIVEQLL